MIKNKILIVLILFMFIVSINNLSALDYERENRLNFGHVLKIKNLFVEPGNLEPGGIGKITVDLENTANFFIDDIRVEITLPEDVFFLDDINRKKIARIESGETKRISYNIRTSSSISEGIYKTSIKADYVNHIGDERQENDTFGIAIGGAPNFFTKIEDSEIYQGNYIGKVTITFVNNDISDIKFFTAELKESEDYEIISAAREYIGEIDSDDFESIDFKLNVDKKKKILVLPIKVEYKDSLNKYYSKEIDLILKLRTAKELGINANNTTQKVIGIIILIGVIYFFYRRWKKKKKKY